MSEQRIVVETACEHGRCVLYHDVAGQDELCRDGSRRIVELPDMEKLREALALPRWVLSLAQPDRIGEE